MGDLQRTFSAGGHTLLAARALIADDSVRSGRASITDLASDTQAEDFHVVELNQSGAIVAHFTHPEHCAMVVGAELRQKQQQQSQRMGEHLGRQSATRWKSSNMGSLVSAKEIRAACETEKCESEKSMGIRSDVGGRRFAWAKHYTVPESAYMDADDTATSGEAMSERFQKMRANNQPEPEPEPEPAEDESLADVRAENAMAAMEIKRLRAELEQLHSAGGPGALLSPAEQVSLDEAAEKLGNREARLDLRLQEISREKDAADNVLKASQAEVRSHDVRLKELRAVLRVEAAKATTEARRAREKEEEVFAERSRCAAAKKKAKQLQAQATINANDAVTARKDAEAARVSEAQNRKALANERQGQAALDKKAAEAELATHTAEFEEEKKLRAAVKKETREAKKEAKRVGGTIAERQYVLDEMLKQATLAQRKADQDWAAAQQMFDHSNLVLAAQSRRISAMTRRTDDAEGRLATLEQLMTGAVPSAEEAAATEEAADGRSGTALANGADSAGEISPMAAAAGKEARRRRGATPGNGSGAAAAQATLIKHAPSLSFLKVLSTTERMHYLSANGLQEPASLGEAAA